MQQLSIYQSKQPLLSTLQVSLELNFRFQRACPSNARKGILCICLRRQYGSATAEDLPVIGTFLYPNSATFIDFLCTSHHVFSVHYTTNTLCFNFRQNLKEAALQERLRRKAELQNQARRPMGYSASMEAEKRKQQSLKKTKEEQRNALCEELGRGC